MASKFLPAVAGLASRAIPYITNAFAVGKRIAPSVIGAVGKIQNAIGMAKNVGKLAHGVGQKIAPELTKKVEDMYNAKKIGGLSLGDIVERGEKGLAKAAGVADQAKAVFANIPTN